MLCLTVWFGMGIERTRERWGGQKIGYSKLLVRDSFILSFTGKDNTKDTLKQDTHTNIYRCTERAIMLVKTAVSRPTNAPNHLKPCLIGFVLVELSLTDSLILANFYANMLMALSSLRLLSKLVSQYMDGNLILKFSKLRPDILMA